MSERSSDAHCETTIRPTNRRVGTRYGIASLLLATNAVWQGSWTLWMLWPAVSTGLIAAAYFGLGPGIFRKKDGRIPLAARLVLGPVIDAQVLSWFYYKRQCEPWNAVTDNVWIGRRLTDAEAQQAVDAGVTAVVDATVYFSEAEPFRKIEYLPVPILDLTAPTLHQLDAAVAFIEEQSQRGVVYVHCKIGYSRSAAIVGAWLMASGVVDSADAAMTRLREVRPRIVMRPEIVAILREYEQSMTLASSAIAKAQEL